MIKNLENEIWKTIEGFEDYQISNLGRVKSFKKWKGTNERILKPYMGKFEYSFVWLSRDKEIYQFQLYKLLYENFSGDKLKDNECIHHKNRDHSDNRLENLQKMTVSDHSKHHHTEQKNSNFGKDFSGENSGNHKLSKKEVLEIKQLLKEKKIRQKEMSDMYHISNSTISDIKCGRSWKYVL